MPLFLGAQVARADEKAVVKIPQEKPAVVEPVKQPIEKEREEEQAAKEAPKDKEKATYSYDPTNKVDPFKSFIVVRKELEEEKHKKPRTYLETLDLTQLVLSATMLTPNGNWALVRDSKGDGHVIKVGTPIGRRGGRVIEIKEDEVIVRESYTDIRGRETVKDKPIKLPAVD